MADDPNETARRAFGDAGPAASSPPPRLAGEARAALGPRDVPMDRLADWWTRAGGFLLDQLIVASAAILAALAIAAATGAGGRSTDLLAYATAIPLGILYAPLLMARAGARNGQTLGKQIVGIRVVRTDGAPVTFWTGFVRTVIAQQLLIAVTFYVYAVVDYLWPLRDPQNQALHDKIAKTWVLRTAAPAGADAGRPPSPAPFPQPDEMPVQGWLPPRAPGA
jgi:uncharacterized RDD family membrane protein YckC